MHRALWIGIATLGLVGCAGVQKPAETLPTEPVIENVELDPALVRANVNGDKVEGTELIESSEVFAEAQEAFRKRQYDKAISKYAILIEHFEDSGYYLPSLYNSGLALDFLKRHEEASVMYRTVVDNFRGRAEATDALFRLAGSLARLEKHADVITVIEDEIFGRTGLVVSDKVEAYSRLGDALLAQGDYSRAETNFRMALSTNRRATPDDALPEDAYFIASAQYGVARVYHELFRAIKFKLPPDRMERDLNDKIQLFKQAQGLYIRTVGLGHPYWTTASRFQVARMYEDFYADLLASEIPELTDEEAELYFEELRSKLRPIMESALQYYEKTITLSERQGVDNEYTQQTQEALERLKSYITNPELQAEDEARVRAGSNIKALGDPPDPRGEPATDDQKDDPDASDEKGPDSEFPDRPVKDDDGVLGAG